MSRVPTRNKAVAVTVGVVGLGVALWVYVAATKQHAIAQLASSVGDEDDGLESATSQAVAPADAPVVDAHAPVLDKAKRDAMREAIYRAWGMTPPDERTDPSTWPQHPTNGGADFGSEYVRQRIREDYFPLALQCYQRGLTKNPQLAGKIVASFRIVGSKNTGGLIDWVDLVDEETTLDDPDVNECLKQSLYSVTFDAPPNDGVVTVKYPIQFAPDDPD